MRNQTISTVASSVAVNDGDWHRVALVGRIGDDGLGLIVDDGVEAHMKMNGQNAAMRFYTSSLSFGRSNWFISNVAVDISSF